MVVMGSLERIGDAADMLWRASRGDLISQLCFENNKIVDGWLEIVCVNAKGRKRGRVRTDRSFGCS